MSDLYESIHRERGNFFRENVNERINLYSLAAADPEFARAERLRVYTDILHFFNYYAWTHDPRPKMLRLYGYQNPMLPFCLYPFQEDYVLKVVRHILDGVDLLTEKSREMGATWMLAGVFLWFWLQPTSGNDFLVGSRKFDLVDKIGSLDTIFEKFRYMLYNLDPLILPPGFNKNEHDKVGLLVNPATGSYIKGEGNNANFGTGGRYRAGFMDEYAKWEETDEQAWTSMGDAVQCRLPVSTPWGLGRKFAQLRFSNAIEVETLHWTLHPLKSIGLYVGDDGKPHSEWYDEEIGRRSDNVRANVGQELDIDYMTSGTPYFDNNIVQKRFIELSKQELPTIRLAFERAPAGVELHANSHGPIHILEPADPHSIFTAYRYCIAADVAEGLEKGDNSTFYVYDRVLKKDVAWFAGKIDTHLFAHLLRHFQKRYDGAWIAVENNNHGHAVVQKLKELDADQIYEQQFSEILDRDSVKLGWNTNNVTRPIQCSDLRSAISDGVDGISDAEFFKEALTFITNEKGKPEAAAGSLDDRVLAQTIKFQIHKWLPAPVRRSNPVPDYGYNDHGKMGEPARHGKRKKGAGFV